MTKRKIDAGLKAKARTLGARTFVAIAAVEGMRLSQDSRKRLADLKARQLTPEQRREEVIRAYTKPKTRA